MSEGVLTALSVISTICAMSYRKVSAAEQIFYILRFKIREKLRRGKKRKK